VQLPFVKGPEPLAGIRLRTDPPFQREVRSAGLVAVRGRLAENLGNVIEQRNYFNSHLPDWKSKARQWSDFFGHYAGLDLMRKDNSADKVGD